jgi:anti-anti-sigma factor
MSAAESGVESMQPAHAGTAKAADGSFTITSRRLEHGILIALTGDVDLSTASIVEDEVRRAEESEDLIVLDLDHVSFMDSSGIRMIVGAHRRLRARDGTLRLANVPAQVRRLFELAGILEHLEIADPEDGQEDPLYAV